MLHYRLQLDSAACEGNHGPYNNASQGGVVKKPFLALLLIAVLPWPWTFPSAHAKEPQAPAPLPIEQMRAVAYTQEFAKRFALPDPQPGTEPEGGIQAMEFAVEDAKAKYPHKRFATYQCVLKLYLDNKLPIAYPEEGVAGAKSMLIQPIHFFLWPDPDNKHWLRLSEQDRKYFGVRQGRYNLMAWLATPDFLWRKQGNTSGSMSYEEYHRDLFPGLAYLKIDMTCQAYSWMDKAEAMQLWLRHERAPDNQKLRIEAEDFVRFAVPYLFYQKVIGWSKQTHVYNARILDEENAKRRSQQQPSIRSTPKNISESDTN